MSYIVVFITASSEEEAEKIANGIIDAKLAACVSIIAGIRSIFIWKGKRDTANECLLIIKTQENKFKRLKEAVKKLHSYETPEIISMPIVKGDSNYLNWIKEVLR